MKQLTEFQKTVVDDSFENLLEKAGNIAPELKEALAKKFDEDRLEFSLCAKDALPSDQPAYWAKKNCNKCYGRGITGTKIILNGPAQLGIGGHYSNEVDRVDLACKCVNKAYSTWLGEFRLFYNMLKAQMVADTVNEGENNADR